MSYEVLDNIYLILYLIIYVERVLKYDPVVT